MRIALVAATSVAVVVAAGPVALAQTSSTAPDGAARSARTAPTAPSAASPLGSVSVRFARLASGFDQPTGVTSAADGSSRLFVTERTGRIRVVTAKGKVRARPYLDLRSGVRSTGSEQGLLGLAFPANFSKRPHLYVAYVAANGSLQVSRFTAKSRGAGRARPGSERKLINVPHPGAENHNGGSLAFGRGGLLFISTGDGGGSGTAAQSTRSRLGKILRIDVARSCGKRAYCVPRTNPYASSATAQRTIWAMGLRNPWRISVDAKTGALWIGDVGQSRYEEIDRVPAGKGGRNFGWPCKEGRVTYAAGSCRSGTTYTAPVETYGRAKGQSVTGGVVYRGKKYRASLGGRYVFADFVSGRVWARSSSGAKRVVGQQGGISGFGTTGSGEIRAVTLDGGLYALRAATRR